MCKAFENAPGFNADAFCNIHASDEQISSIRINPAKLNDLSDLSFSVESPVPWCNNGWYLNERPFYTFDPLLHAGAYYVQEASSMFLEQALKQTLDCSVPLKVLDLCAAPGGKSTHIQSVLSPGSVLVSNEVIRSRAAILEENITKWGGANVIVTNNDPRDFSRFNALFHAIVVDAPCSGSGMFRKDASAAENWSADLVALCSQRQQRILADIWPSLKEDGILVYATCSYSVEEDEMIADFIIEELNAESIPLSIESDWNIVSSNSPKHNATGYRFYPYNLKGEGFYLGVFKKTSGGDTFRKKPAAPKWETLAKSSYPILERWLSVKDMRFISINDSILALTQPMEETLLQLQSLYIKRAGITMGKMVGKELIPDHSLALSTLANPSISSIELDRDLALQFLRKEEIRVGDVPKGWTITRYKNHPMGWIKVLTNRINNYYPKEWRILKPA
ncbi:hypothetical protein HY58_16395 [Flavihumibacter sp. ZG627]|nr:hypothetical protein HY58_16395 [Flavihumibacter sp. ZG627]